MTPERVLAVGPTGAATVYSSIRAASRALSGTGSDNLRTTICSRLNDGGGYVGSNWVQSTSLESVHRPR